MKIYLAGPIFSLNERNFNKDLANAIFNEAGYEVFLPQENPLKGEPTDENFSKLFIKLIKKIDESDLMVSIVDGADSDSGTCIEMGYAYGIKKPIIGIRTDFRNLETKGVNLMVFYVCDKYILLKDKQLTIKDLANKIIEAINDIFEDNRRARVR